MLLDSNGDSDAERVEQALKKLVESLLGRLAHEIQASLLTTASSQEVRTFVAQANATSLSVQTTAIADLPLGAGNGNIVNTVYNVDNSVDIDKIELTPH